MARKRSKKKHHKKCAGLKGKGKLKRGFKWKKGASCPVKTHKK